MSFIKKETIRDIDFIRYFLNSKIINVIRFYAPNEIGFIIDEKGILTKELKNNSLSN